MKSSLVRCSLLCILLASLFGTASVYAAKARSTKAPLASATAATVAASAAIATLPQAAAPSQLPPPPPPAAEQMQPLVSGEQDQATQSSSLSPVIAVPASTAIASSNSTQPVLMPTIPKAPSFIPTPPSLPLKGYILVDANSGYVIAEKNADERLSPASITKVMSLYLAAYALKTGRMHLDDKVLVSANAWKVGGSKMFIKVGEQIPVREIIDGIVIASGNDATVALAEHMFGSEQAFATVMNNMAQQLGMKNSSFTDSNGLPAPNHYSSPRDLAILGRAWLVNFPEYYPWFKQKFVSHAGIKQANRNKLLWRDNSVDGFKTGHTDEAGYCLLSSAMRNGMRLIAVVMGAANEAVRNTASMTLLDYGFRFYESHRLYAADVALTRAKVWLGKRGSVELGLQHDLYATIPGGQYQRLKASMTIDKTIKAPLKKGQVLGSVNVSLGNKQIATQPLVALQEVPKAGFFFSAIDRLLMMF
jgi:serine-type D-Ala-D-Ala carboxypeptidase (penicillin-binding protein 5/6)